MKNLVLYLLGISAMLLITIVLPIYLALNSEYADTTSYIEAVTVEDMWTTKGRRVRIIGKVTTTVRYTIYYITISNGEQQKDITISRDAYEGLKIGDSIYATVHYSNKDNSIVSAYVLSEEEYNEQIQKLTPGLTDE